MDLILKTDVENLGYKDDLVSVKNGYGRNFLIPQGKAVFATPSAKKMLAEDIKQKAHKEKKIIDSAKSTAEGLSRIELKISAKAGKSGKLFGAVTNSDVSDKLNEVCHAIEMKYIHKLGGSIKRAVKYAAKIRLHREVIAEFQFEVTAKTK